MIFNSAAPLARDRKSDFRAAVLLFLLGASLATTARAETIWVEGEAADSSTVVRHNWYDSVKRDALSGGDWLSHFSGDKEGEAELKFAAQEGGSRRMWFRANSVGDAKLSWSLNGGAWNAVDFSSAQDVENIAQDDKPDLRFVSWVNVGKVELASGQNSLRVRFHSANSNHGGLDCVVFSDDNFAPEGKLKPGEKLGLADAGMWAFEPSPDSFSVDAAVDLSKLNEDVAGERGYVGMDAKGDFTDGAGAPLRFWAANTHAHYEFNDAESLTRHAKWLAKRGVNVVRSHSSLAPKGKTARLDEVDEEEIERIQRLVAAMKPEGIYTVISPYWAVSIPWRASFGLSNPEESGTLTGMLFWDEKLQAAYKGWWKALLTRENPYTGVPLAKDPSIAFLQIQNEDSLLFWTLQGVKGAALRDLEGKFYKFLIKKHGDWPTARSSWTKRGDGDSARPDDSPENGRAGLYTTWELTQDAAPARQARIADQLEFFGRLMHDFNAEIARYIREDLGCAALVNAGNWHTADAAKLYDIERWSYGANEVIGVNRYFGGGKHVNPTEKGKEGWAVSVGDTFEGESVLKRPREFPLTVRQTSGKPFIISESVWVPPMRYQSEGPFLVAAFSGLTGVDAFFWFTTGTTEYARNMGKWQFNTPMLAGQFPATALLHRKGYVTRGEPVLKETRPLADLWKRVPPVAVEDPGFDPNRDMGREFKLSKETTEFPPLGFLAGPVETAFSDTEGSAEVAGIQGVGKTSVKSVTGELFWDAEAGLCVLDAAKAQGFTGFSNGKTVPMEQFQVTSTNAYLTWVAVSLDDQPLSVSKDILVQVGTYSRPYGWKERAAGNDGLRIESIGQGPWNVEKCETSVRFRNANLKRMIVLDENLNPIREFPIGKGVFQMPEDALYLVLKGD